MKEIKFRAWDGDTMIWKGLYVANGHLVLPNETLVRDGVRKLIWMQYIGLKDKNGKEIYEGDIVKQKRGNFVVEYHIEGAGFIFTADPNDIEALSFRLSPEREVRKLELNGLEVIGNIYQNPELV